MQLPSPKLCLLLLVLAVGFFEATAADSTTSVPSIGSSGIHQVQSSTPSPPIKANLNGNPNAGTLTVDGSKQPDVSPPPPSDHHRVKRNKRPIRYHAKSSGGRRQ